MPIYMRIDGIKGDVQPAGGAIGGVWKTSNFLTHDAATAGPVSRAKVHTFLCPSDSSAVQISRVSLTPGGGGVEGRDPMARLKLEPLIRAAAGQGPTGKLYIATDVGVFQNGSTFDAQGRLLVATEGGLWRSGRVQEAVNRMRTSNNLKQLGLAAHNPVSIEFIVRDVSNVIVSTHRLQNATVSRHSGGLLVCFGDGSVR